MKATHPLPILLLFIFTVVSCSRTGDLSGDVFVMDVGKPVRGAGVEISITPVSDQLESELRKIVSDFDKEYAERLKTNEEVCQKDRELRKQIETDSSIRKKVDERVKAIISRDVHESRSQARTWAELDMLVDLGGGKCPWGAELPGWRDRELDMLINKRVRDLALASGAKAVLADVNGHYEVNGLPVGQYYLYAAMDSVSWLVPVRIVPGTQKVHLSNANSGSLRFLTKTTKTPGS